MRELWFDYVFRTFISFLRVCEDTIMSPLYVLPFSVVVCVLDLWRISPPLSNCSIYFSLFFFVSCLIRGLILILFWLELGTKRPFLTNVVFWFQRFYNFLLFSFSDSCLHMASTCRIMFLFFSHIISKLNVIRLLIHFKFLDNVTLDNSSLGLKINSNGLWSGFSQYFCLNKKFRTVYTLCKITCASFFTLRLVYFYCR